MLSQKHVAALRSHTPEVKSSPNAVLYQFDSKEAYEHFIEAAQPKAFKMFAEYWKPSLHHHLPQIARQFIEQMADNVWQTAQVLVAGYKKQCKQYWLSVGMMSIGEKRTAPNTKRQRTAPVPVRATKPVLKLNSTRIKSPPAPKENQKHIGIKRKLVSLVNEKLTSIVEEEEELEEGECRE